MRFSGGARACAAQHCCQFVGERTTDTCKPCPSQCRRLLGGTVHGSMRCRRQLRAVCLHVLVACCLGSKRLMQRWESVSS